MKHKVRFTRSAEIVTEQQIEEAASVMGLHHPTITLKPGSNGSPFWVVEADEELEVLMDVEEPVLHA